MKVEWILIPLAVLNLTVLGLEGLYQLARTLLGF